MIPSLIVMSAPEAEKGNGYLRMGDNLWMYRRNTRTFQHINRDESIGGRMPRRTISRRENLLKLMNSQRMKKAEKLSVKKSWGRCRFTN